MAQKDELLHLAIQLTATEQYLEAVRTLLNGLNQFPKDIDLNGQLKQTRLVFLNKVKQFVAQKRFADAQKRLTAWLRQFPKDAEAQTRLSDIPEMAKQYRAGLRAQAQALITGRNLQGAYTLYRNWLQQYPTDLKAQSDMAQIERRMEALGIGPEVEDDSGPLILKTMEVGAINVPPTETPPGA